MSNQNIFNNTRADAPTPEVNGGIDSGMQALFRSLRFAFLALVIIIIGTMVYFITLGGYMAIPPQEALIVLRFGAYEGTYTKGPLWFFPYPVNQFIRIPTLPQTLKVDYLSDAQRRNRNPRPRLDSGIDGYLLTSDTNIVHSAWSFSYIIADPQKYYESCLTPQDPRENDPTFQYAKTPPTGRGPQTLLKYLFNNAVVSVTASMTIDDILQTKQSEYRDRVMSVFAKSVTDMDIGVVIDNVTLDRVEPPTQTQAAFLEVNTASSTSDTYITEANTFSIRTISQAEAQANAIIAQAESDQKKIVSQLRSESTYFNSILAEYDLNSNAVLVALYNDILGEALSGVREKYLLGTDSDGAKQLRMKLNPELINGESPTARQAAPVQRQQAQPQQNQQEQN